ncbi:hypothetical protein ZOSMA_74G00340 [Zostera marina]|uniref:Protein LURP-one-related 8 n=1 Tax=Zostera marina TaxID=29655 RepID=A0A0K9NQ17_ZOSMR|nr:hypothetical protein ZOSMA_74G00340 [Zostera marina]
MAAKMRYSDEEITTLTVWKKSLMFNCKGFTVYDSKGNLAFRVDNYASTHLDEILLMDCTGKALLTLHRKKVLMSFSQANWKVFNGNDRDSSEKNPLFAVVKKKRLFFQSKVFAHVTRYGGEERDWEYSVEGSFGGRCWSVYDRMRRTVAEMKKKKEKVAGVSFGDDVYTLVVNQEAIQTEIAMAVAILLDQT